jgi:hypothetical protein
LGFCDIKKQESSQKGAKMKRRLTKWAVWYMVTVMCLVGITPRLYAGLSPSEITALSQSDRHSDLQKIQKVLESKMIRERLKQLGFSEEGIQNRLNQLPDDQIHQVASNLDELDVGGSATGVLISILVIIILGIIVYYLLTHKIEIK